MNIKLRSVLMPLAILAAMGTSSPSWAQTPPPDPFATPEGDGTEYTELDPSQYGAFDIEGAAAGLDLSSLRFFSGKRRDCMKALGGLLNCCKKTPPQNQSPKLWEYMEKMLAKTTNAEGQDEEEADGSDPVGSWASMMQGANHEDLMAQLSSNMESLMGGGDTGGGENTNSTMGASYNDFFNHEKTVEKPKLAWYCDNDEFELAVGKQTGTCTHLGSFCQTRVLGVCVIKKDRYCCFNSPVSRVLREHLDRTGVADLGTAKKPKCQGITFDQMSGINADQVDTDEIIGRMAEGEFMPNMDELMNGNFEDMESVLDGANSMLGDTTRQSPSDRNAGRVGATDSSGAYTSIETDQASRRPVYDSAWGPHKNSVRLLTTETLTGYVKQGLGIPVVRDGTAGTIQARITPISGTTAQVGVDYTIAPSVVMWGPNQAQEQRFQLQFLETATPGRRILLELSGTLTTDGVQTPLVIDGNTLVTITIQGE